jgi:hypothetical protein
MGHRKDRPIRSYQQARELLNLRKSQGRNYAKLHHNVYLEPRANDYIAVKYHNTDIVVYHPDGKIELHCGGWRTATTKRNINAYSPFSVWQEKGVWYVNKGPDFDPGTIMEFEDGMILTRPKPHDLLPAARRPPRRLTGAGGILIRERITPPPC